MKILKRILTLMLVLTIIASICVISTFSSSAQGTGVGLSEWALNAYYSHWRYVYGGCTPGAVDCSGLIYSYTGCERCGDPQFNASPKTGSLSSLPNIHGLGLWQPGHVGVYVGSGMAVDARGDDYGVCYESVYSHGWYYWFKVNGVSYPTNGWENCNGSYFYYENGEYLTNTSRTIDGITYSFSSTGTSDKEPGDTSAIADAPVEKKQKNDEAQDTSSNDSKTLKVGSTGSAVEKLQQRLLDLGYYQGLVDGDFGTLTEKAFKKFQKAAGLYVDGIAGSDVDVLYSDDAPMYESGIATSSAAKPQIEEEEEPEEIEEEKEETSTYSIGDYSDEVAKMQERLIQLGYLDGEADGSFGTLTEDAVKLFQEQNGLENDGVANEDTLEVLFSTDAITMPTEKPTEEIKKTIPTEKVVKETSPISTEIELQTSKLASNALSGVASKMTFSHNSDGNNFDFLIWLVLMIILLISALIVVYTIEKKKNKAKAERTRHRYR